MKKLLTALLSLFVITLVPSIPAESDFEFKADEINVTNQTTSSPSHGYVVQLRYGVSEPNVPNFIVRNIYTNTSIPNQDTLELYKANSLSYDATKNILQLINISYEAVFSLSGLNHTLELFDITFVDFYNDVRIGLGLTGIQVRDALNALQIDANAFSSGISFGDPDPWTEFQKGNFTQENVERACNVSGITVDILFNYIRNIVYNNVVNATNFINLLRNHSINEPEALIIWNAREVSLFDVYNSTIFRGLIDDIVNKLQNNVFLGILTQIQEIFLSVNRKTYDFINTELNNSLILLTADSLSANQSYRIGASINETVYPNLVLLRHNEVTQYANETTPSIQIGFRNQNLVNCTYVTLINGSIVAIDIAEATYNNTVYRIPQSSSEEVVTGSALICNNTLYGLARSSLNNTILIDSFYVEEVTTTESTSTSTSTTSSSASPSSSTTVPSGAETILYTSAFGLFISLCLILVS